LQKKKTLLPTGCQHQAGPPHLRDQWANGGRKLWNRFKNLDAASGGGRARDGGEKNLRSAESEGSRREAGLNRRG